MRQLVSEGPEVAALMERLEGLGVSSVGEILCAQPGVLKLDAQRLDLRTKGYTLHCSQRL